MSSNERIVLILIIAVGLVVGMFGGYLLMVRPVTEVQSVVRAIDTPTPPAIDAPIPPMLPTPSYTVYVVQTDDNLWTIANRFDTTVEAIMKLNVITGTLIYSGTQLRIPSGGNAVLTLLITPTASDTPRLVPPTPTPMAILPTPTPAFMPAGTAMTVNNWEVRVEGIETVETITDPSTGATYEAAGRWALLFMAVTNHGLRADTFVPSGEVQIQDAQGTLSDHYPLASWAARASHGTESAGYINPGATIHGVWAFDISRQSSWYALVSGPLADSGPASAVLDIP